MSQLNSPSDDKIIHPTSYLTLNYRIVLDSGKGKGEVFIDTYNGSPATLQMGSGQWSSGLEQGLIGHKEGDSFTYTVKAAEAFGERNPDLIQAVTQKMLAEHAGEKTEFNPDDLVEFTAAHKGKFSGIFKRFEGNNAIFDFNHPLAGTDLKIEVSIIGVL